MIEGTVPFRFGEVTVIPTEHVDVGTGIVGVAGGRAVFMHPLDLIAIKYRGDVAGHADAVLAWIVARVERQAAAAVRRIDGMFRHEEFYEAVLRIEAHLAETYSARLDDLIGEGVG